MLWLCKHCDCCGHHAVAALPLQLMHWPPTWHLDCRTPSSLTPPHGSCLPIFEQSDITPFITGWDRACATIHHPVSNKAVFSLARIMAAPYLRVLFVHQSVQRNSSPKCCPFCKLVAWCIKNRDTQSECVKIEAAFSEWINYSFSEWINYSQIVWMSVGQILMYCLVTPVIFNDAQ